MTRRLTTAQAIVSYLQNQYVSRDGKENRFFEGCFGIFGHGNVAGMGQALEQIPSFPYYLCRNEQAMVHTAAAFAKVSNRLRTLACTSSIGPGATNMLTGAAVATVNRLPVLLLPGDIFARRNVAPVLQQLESSTTQDISVNDCFKPVSRYWDRIERPEQILTSLPEAMRVSDFSGRYRSGGRVPAARRSGRSIRISGAVFRKKSMDHSSPALRPRLAGPGLAWIRSSKKPIIIAGGGVIYSDATEALRDLPPKLKFLLAKHRPEKVLCPTIIRKIWAPSV